MSEIEYLRKLEQELQRLHERLRGGYSGLPEISVIESELNDRLVQLLKSQEGLEQ